MNFRDLVFDKVFGKTQEALSLSRTVAFLTFVVLSAGFMGSSMTTGLSWHMFIAYPVGVTTAFAPQLFIKFLDVLKGTKFMRKEGHHDDD